MRAPPLGLTVTLFASLHLALALAVPLIEDETYYALWATAPDWGYYDHPPMIAWWIAAGEALFGVNRLGVRILPVLAMAAVTPMVWRIAWLVSGEARAAGLAALFYNATVLVLVLGFTATPDAPSAFFWALTTWAMVEAIRATNHATRWWLLAGLAAGLGVQSKFTNLFLGVGIVVWLVASPLGRAQLRRPAVWAAAALGIAVLIPLGLWNLAHHGLGLTRQFGRIESAGFSPKWLLDYVIVTAALLSPLIFWHSLRGTLGARGLARLLVWLMAPLLIYMAYHATHAQVQANWLIPIFAGLSVLAGLNAAATSDRQIAGAAGSGVAIGVLALVLALWPGAPVFPGHNPANQTKGWPGLVVGLNGAVAASGAEWIATSAYGLTGSLQFYLPETPVWAMTETRRYGFRGGFPARLCDAPGLLVTAGDGDAGLRAMFTRQGAAQTLTRRSGGAVLDSYTVTPVAGLHGPGAPYCGGG